MLKDRLRGSLDEFKDNLHRIFLDRGLIDKDGNNIELDSFNKGTSKNDSTSKNFSLNKKRKLNKIISTQEKERLTSSSNI